MSTGASTYNRFFFAAMSFARRASASSFVRHLVLLQRGRSLREARYCIWGVSCLKVCSTASVPQRWCTGPTDPSTWHARTPNSVDVECPGPPEEAG